MAALGRAQNTTYLARVSSRIVRCPRRPDALMFKLCFQEYVRSLEGLLHGILRFAVLLAAVEGESDDRPEEHDGTDDDSGDATS